MRLAALLGWGLATFRRADLDIDEVKLRVVDVMGEGFSEYTDHDIAELELALRTDDPAELERIYERWRNGGLDKTPTKVLAFADEVEPECPDCQRPVRFGYPPQCEKHPYTPD